MYLNKVQTNNLSDNVTLVTKSLTRYKINTKQKQPYINRTQQSVKIPLNKNNNLVHSRKFDLIIKRKIFWNFYAKICSNKNNTYICNR